jgi:hypothetical protein
MRQAKIAVAGMAAAASIGAAGMAQTNTTAGAVQKGWADSVTVKGDVRYRHETIQDDSKLDASKRTYTRQRDRIRARLGAEAKCSDKLKAGVGLSTGQADPISGNQTLGDGFAKKEMRLDVAYFDYSFFGDSPNEVHAVAGKMNTPLIVLPDDLCWDPDLRPEGVALRGQAGRGMATVLANGASLWLQERADRGDAMLYAGQAALRLQFVPEVVLTLGGTYCDYEGLRGADVMDWEGKNNAYGNSTGNGTVAGGVTNKAWASEFKPVAGFAQIDLWIFKKPLSLYAQNLANVEAKTQNRGLMCGVALGKAKNPRTWEIGYSYAELQKDAVVGALTDSDRWGGGTDGRGHRVYGKYQIAKNLQAAVTYFQDEKKISDSKGSTGYDRLQADLAVSF